MTPEPEPFYRTILAKLCQEGLPPPHPQDQEQRLRFAGAAVKRYLTPKVRETQVRWQGKRRGTKGRLDEGERGK